MVNNTLGDRISLDGLDSDTPAFNLRGGLYDFAAYCETWGDGGKVTVERLAPGGAEWIAYGDGLSANGNEQFHLPPGVYRIAVDAATDPIAVELSRIPLGD